MKLPPTTILLRALAYLPAALIGAILGAGTFYVILFFPTWFTNPEVLLAWGYLGIPLGGLAGVILFAQTTARLGRHFGQRVTPREFTDAYMSEQLKAKEQSLHASSVALALRQFEAHDVITASCASCNETLSVSASDQPSQSGPSNLKVFCRCGRSTGTFQLNRRDA